MSVSDIAFFSLISYNEENYPDPDNYDKVGIQLLNKRLLTRLNREFHFMAKNQDERISMRYFIVSEYGEERNRLHYHAIYFFRNVDPIEFHYVFWKSFLEETWKKGFCSAFELDHKTITYTCKYLQKSYNMMLYSKGLGKSAYAESFQAPFDDELLTYVINGKRHVIPKSWQDDLDKPERRAIALAKIRDDMMRSSPKLLFRDRITLNNSFLRDNPVKERTYELSDNLDIQPNYEF